MHEVVVVALDGVSPFDLGIACETFAHVHTPGGDAVYAVRVCGGTRGVRSGAFDIVAPHGLDALVSADTVIVPGLRDIAGPVPEAALSALRGAAARGARMVSICTGAFVLAAAELLDGRRATTHWLAADDLARRFPLVSVDRDVLFVDEGDVITSAGASAGLDMCLHLIARDHGRAAAAHAAKLAVAPLHREGGQAQFVVQGAPPSDLSLAPLMEWVLRNIDRRHDVEALAARAGLSPRTLARRFQDQAGTTPMRWLNTVRIRRAQELLEATTLPVERVAAAAGFDSAITFRKSFARLVGVSPVAHRRRFAAR